SVCYSFSLLFCFSFFLFFVPVGFLSAGPVVQKHKGNGKDEKAAAAEAHRRLIRHRRNISWYKQHADFWSWYKYFTDNGNQEAVQELDRIYLAYLQNKNRAEGRKSYKAYLRHLGEIYKSCADSEDPNCVASYTARPKPEPPKPAPIKTCDPTKDPYCLYAALVQGKSPYLPLVLPAAAAPAPAPVKAPAPLYVRSAVPVKDPHSGYHYYSPAVQSFLSKEQKAELLRICSADDVECLQYHLRAAYGYKPSAGPLPSYAHLGCDPKSDPNCKPQLVQKAPSGLYLQYPGCDPLRDPYCAYAASLVVYFFYCSCNPLFEDGCNPLTATRFSSPPGTYKNEDKEEAAAIRAAPPAAEQRHDPYAMFREAYANANANRASDPFAMYRQPRYEEPAQEEHHPLGPPGKTKEGYDCFIGYDRECFPVRPSEPRSGASRHAAFPAFPALPARDYEPHLNSDGSRAGVIEPADPHCDPEYDPDCRLRRYEPEEAQPEEAQPERHVSEEHSQGAAESEQEQQEAEPYESGQEEPYMAYPQASQGMSSFQDILRLYGDKFPEQDDHRAYADDYRKK
uniref:Actinodin1 n=1 Tax=Myripristis murdjan TaxID=586833 RepID=A0A668A2G9_9TELE